MRNRSCLYTSQRIQYSSLGHSEHSGFIVDVSTFAWAELMEERDKLSKLFFVIKKKNSLEANAAVCSFQCMKTKMHAVELLLCSCFN